MNEQHRDHQTPNTDPVESITVREAELTVRKAIVEYRDSVVKVEFSINSVADERLSVTLIDELPQEIEAENVGFHPDYDPDAWSVGDRRELRYETVVDPGEERETVYGAQVESLDGLERFATEPRVEIEPLGAGVTGAISDASEPDTGDDDDVGRAGNTSSTNGGPADASPPEGVEHPVHTGSSNAANDRPEDPDGDVGVEPSSPEPPVTDANAGVAEPQRSAPSATNGTRDPPGDSPESSTDTGSAESPAGEGVIDVMVTELQRGELTDDDRAVIRDELGMDRSPSDQVRLQHVQETVTDLVAYRDALEGFIDEHGPAETLVEELQTALEANETDIAQVAGSVDDLQSKFESLEESHIADIELVENRLSTIENDVNDELTALEEDLESVQDDLARIKEWREKLSVATQLADAGVKSGNASD